MLREGTECRLAVADSPGLVFGQRAAARAETLATEVGNFSWERARDEFSAAFGLGHYGKRSCPVWPGTADHRRSRHT